MSSSLKKMIKKSKKELSGMIEESDLNNNDCFITALLDIDPAEGINIPDDKIQKILNKEGIYTQQELLTLTVSEIWNDELYSYMHDIFGPDVIEMFDLKYNPKNVLNKDKDTAQAADSQNTEKDKGTPT